VANKISTEQNGHRVAAMHRLVASMEELSNCGDAPINPVVFQAM
jgi:hypothetical protein